MGGDRPAVIQVVSAWDIDRRKVGRDVAEAIFAPPNCTARFCEAVGPTGAVVQMAPVLDGYPAHMAEMTPDRRFEPADLPEPSSDDVIRHLDQTGTEVLVGRKSTRLNSSH